MAQHKLNVSDDLSLPLEMGGQAAAVFGIRGSGKTNTAGVLAEELLKAGQPIAVVDPTDAWWGLRSSADGRREGFPVFIFGGTHGDLPLAETDGHVVAEFIVQERVPVILSVRHLRKSGQRRFVTELCEELYHLKGRDEYRSPLTVFVDEAGTFIPARVQNLGKGEWPLTRTVGAVEDLVARGRNTGFGVVMINPRPATLNADVRSLCDTIITHRTPAPLDRKAFKEWIEENATLAEQDEVLKSLATLKNGEAWVWAPVLGVIKRVQVRLRESFDSSATPKAGQKLAPPKKLAEIDKEKLKGRLSAAVEKAKSEDPKLLRARVKELEAAVATAAAAKPGKEKVVQTKEVIKRVEVPVLKDAQIQRLEGAIKGLQSVLEKAGDHYQRAIDLRDGLALAMKAAKQPAGGAVPVAPAAPSRPGGKLQTLHYGPRGEVRSGAPDFVGEPGVARRSTPAAPPRDLPSGGPPDDDRELPPVKKGARQIVRVLCQWHPRRLERDNLAFLAGFSTGGTFSDYLSILRRWGFLDEEAGDTIGPTKAAFDFLNGDVPPRPSTPEEFLNIVRGLKKMKAGAVRMVEYVVGKGAGATVSRDELAEATGFSKGGTFSDYLSLGRRSGVLVDAAGGAVMANPIIFEEAS